jgi:hypothetical protein
LEEKEKEREDREKKMSELMRAAERLATKLVDMGLSVAELDTFIADVQTSLSLSLDSLCSLSHLLLSVLSLYSLSSL